MRAHELIFPDNFFTHSLTTYVVANLDDAPFAAGHLLKEGGTAVVCTWKPMPHGETFKKAHYATRGKDAKLALTWVEIGCRVGSYILACVTNYLDVDGSSSRGCLFACEGWF